MRSRVLAYSNYARNYRHPVTQWSSSSSLGDVCLAGTLESQPHSSTLSIPLRPHSHVASAGWQSERFAFSKGAPATAQDTPQNGFTSFCTSLKLPLCLSNHSLSPHRAFSTSPRLQKKFRKDASKATKLEVAASRSSAYDNDPYDLTTLNDSLKSALDRLEHDLSALRPGGRFNPATIENLRVPLGKLKQAEEGHGLGKFRPSSANSIKKKQELHEHRAKLAAASRTSGASAETVRMADIAQVVPRGGRSVVMMVGDEKHVKPVLSALQSSGLNLNPQPSPTNPLELAVPIPPPTAETRLQTVAEAGRAGERAAAAVREARGTQQKVLRAMKLAGTVRADDGHRAQVRMEECVEKAYERVREMVEGAKKVLGQVSVQEARTKI